MFKVGDLVSHAGRLGIITRLSEPTPMFPHQIANVLFYSGQVEEKTTFSLKKLEKNLDNEEVT